MSKKSSTDQAKDKPKSEEAFWDTLLDEAEQPEQPVAARVTQDASEVNPAATGDALNPPESPPPITSSSISPPQSPPPITASSTSPSLMQPKKQKLDYDHVTRDLLKYVVNSSETAMLEEKYNDKLKSAALNVLIMLSIITAFFGLTEEWSFGDSLWFSFVTMTTIGYGDFTPTTPFGRGWFVVLSIVGLGQMTLFLAGTLLHSFFFFFFFFLLSFFLFFTSSNRIFFKINFAPSSFLSLSLQKLLITHQDNVKFYIRQ